MPAVSDQKHSGKKDGGALHPDQGPGRQIGLDLRLGCNDAEPIQLPDHWLTPVELESFGIDPEALAPEQRKDYCAALMGQTVRHYKAMRSHLARVGELVLLDGERDLPAVMLEPAETDPESARSNAVRAIAQWTFEDGQDRNETPVFMGALSSSRTTLDAITALNRMKDEFSELVNRLRLATDPQSVLRGNLYNLLSEVMDAKPKVLRSQMIGAMLRDVLHPRLNIRQLTRAIPVATEVPVKVRWRWQSGPAGRKLSREEVLHLLEKKADKPFAMIDIQKVLQAKGESHFALKKKPVWDLRMHVALNKTPGRKGAFMSLKTRLPLFYLEAQEGHHRNQPELVVAPDNAIRFARPGGRKIEDKPFLETLPIYRYLASGEPKLTPPEPAGEGENELA